MKLSWWLPQAPHWVRTGVLIALAALVVGIVAIFVAIELAKPAPEDLPTPGPTSSAPTTAPPSSVPKTSPAAISETITEARIEVSNDKNFIRPETIEAGRSPGFEPFVFTSTRRLERSDPCYVSWKVYNNSEQVYMDDTPCEKERTASEAFWPSDLRLKPGTLRVVADITTGWGAKKTAELTLTVE